MSAQCLQAEEPEAPTLLELLSRSRRSHGAPVGTEQALIKALVPEAADRAQPGVAFLSAIGDGLIAAGDDQQAGWFRCDPCTLHADRDRLILFDASSLAIQADESEALVDALNAMFAEDGMRFCAPHPERWYLHWPQAVELSTHPMDEVVSRPVDDYLPAGSGARDWQRLLSEIQMLLHGHPVNERRMNQGAHCINSLWLWGEGDAMNFEGLTPAFQRVISDDPVAVGAAKALGIEVASVSEAKDLISAVSSLNGCLLHLNDAREGALHGDAVVWRTAVEAMEQRWFMPIRQAIEQGSMGSVEIHDGQGRAWRVEGPQSLFSRLRRLLPGASPSFRDFLS
ncbi:MAG: hypothetical protein ACPG4N_06130 [Gammaproteobacteria bacterium]